MEGVECLAAALLLELVECLVEQPQLVQEEYLVELPQQWPLQAQGCLGSPALELLLGGYLEEPSLTLCLEVATLLPSPAPSLCLGEQPLKLHKTRCLVEVGALLLACLEEGKQLSQVVQYLEGQRPQPTRYLEEAARSEPPLASLLLEHQQRLQVDQFLGQAQLHPQHQHSDQQSRQRHLKKRGFLVLQALDPRYLVLLSRKHQPSAPPNPVGPLYSDSPPPAL